MNDFLHTPLTQNTMDSLIAKLASTSLNEEPIKYIRPKIRKRAQRTINMELPGYLDTLMNQSRVIINNRDAPVSGWEGYVSCMMKSEKVNLVPFKKEYENTMSTFIGGQRLIFLRNFFSIWSGQTTYNDYTYWHRQYFMRLVSMRRELVKLYKRYLKTCEQMGEKIIFHRRRDLLMRIFFEWRDETIANRKPPTPLPSDNKSLYDIEVKVKVKTADGTTKIVIKAPYRELHEKYFSKGLRPSINTYIKTFSQMGFPMTYLEKMLESHDRELKSRPKINEMIERVFGKYSKKK